MSFSDMGAESPSARPATAGSPRSWLVAHAVGVGLLLFLAVGVAPRAQAIAADFGIQLSGLSRASMAVAGLFQRHQLAVLGGLAVALLLDGAILDGLSRDEATAPRRRAWGLALTALLTTAVVLFGTGLAWPLVVLQSRLVG